MNKPITNGRVTRWLLLLQEFDITILDKPGRENVVVDFLSRINNEGDVSPMEDTFPDEHLFSLSINTPWFADIANYLAAGKLPQHLSPKERQRVVRQSAMYSWIEGQLFCIDQILLSDDVLERMKFMTYLRPVMMGHVEDISPTNGLQIKCSTLDTIGLPFSGMPRSMSGAVIVFSGWDHPVRADEMPLQPQVIIEPFERWALDFVGPINPPSR
jgi:hypothetical protein